MSIKLNRLLLSERGCDKGAIMSIKLKGGTGHAKSFTLCILLLCITLELY